MSPARTVAEWITWAEQIPALGYTPVDLGGDGPSETTQTAPDEDGLHAENATARQHDRFAA